MISTNLRTKSISSFFWDLSGNLGNQFIAFVISIVLARILSPSEFGLIAMINVIFIFSNILLDMGLGASLIQRKKLMAVHYSSVFYFNLTIGIFLTIITFFSANSISLFYGRQELVPLIQVMSISFVISSVTLIQNVQLKKQLNFKTKSIIRLISNIVSGLIGITMAYTGYGVWSLVAHQMSNKLVYTSLLWLIIGWYPKAQFSFKALKQLWNFGFNVLLSDILSILFTKVDVVVVAKLFPVATVGYFQRAKSLDKMITQVTSASMMQVLFPVFSSLQNELVRLMKIVEKSINLLSIIVFFIIGIGYLCANEFIVIIFTEKWLPTVPYFKILLLSSFVTPYSSVFVNVIVGRGNSRNHLILSLLKKIPQGLNLGVGFLFGIEGFLYGLVVSGIISFLMNIHFTNKELHQKVYWYIKPLLLPLVLSFVLVFTILTSFHYLTDIKNLYLLFFLKGTIFTTLYFGIAYVLKFPSLLLLINEIKSFRLNRKK